MIVPGTNVILPGTSMIMLTSKMIITTGTTMIVISESAPAPPGPRFSPG